MAGSDRRHRDAKREGGRADQISKSTVAAHAFPAGPACHCSAAGTVVHARTANLYLACPGRVAPGPGAPAPGRKGLRWLVPLIVAVVVGALGSLAATGTLALIGYIGHTGQPATHLAKPAVTTPARRLGTVSCTGCHPRPYGAGCR
jgi:hypothetical protein